ncbi:MAG: SAM-dependent methyltransferase, partial [Halobacteriota archaeon]
DVFAETFFESIVGAFETVSVYLGDRLGYYEVLADVSVTPRELARATDTDERYAREWLEHQTVVGVLAVEDESVPADLRRYALPASAVEVLTDRDSLNYLAPMARLFVGSIAPLEDLVDAYRTGAGIAYAAYGPDLHEGQAAMNRPAFLHLLGEEWLPSIPDVDARLRSDTPARVADVGCGHGWSSIGIAESYEHVRVDGFDLDEASVKAARANVATAGLDDRVTIHHRDAGDPGIEGDYDLVTAFECIHDMPDPVSVLRTMRRLAGDDGTVVVMDERVGDDFTAAGTDVERLMYGFSFTHCLPVGRVDEPSAATGTVMRAGTLREYATEAGFEDVTVLPIENDFFRFYRLESEGR